MDKENDLPMSKVLENIFSAFFKVINDLRLLATLEAKLAKRSLVQLLFLTLILVALLTTTWFCLLGVMVSYFISLQFSLIAAFAMATGINALLAVIVFGVILRCIGFLTFRATRRQLHRSKNLFTGTSNE